MPKSKIYLNIRTLRQPTDADISSNKAITLGDLHCNPMKLIHTLVHYGIMEMNQEKFKELWQIYDDIPISITSEEIARNTFLSCNKFIQLIQSLKINKPGMLILLGDELADRGKNDLLMLAVLHMLHVAEVPYWIQLSNHGLLALAHYEGKSLFPLMSGQQQSLDLFKSLEQRLKSFKESQDAFESLKNSFINNAYRKHIKLIGYQTQQNGDMLIYSHAPIDLQTLNNLATFLGVEKIDEKTIVQLIDEINSTAFKAIQEGKFIEKYVNKYEDYANPVSALYELLWNRKGDGFPRTAFPGNCLNIHGHVGARHPVKSGYVNLDNDLGKPQETAQNGSIIPADDKGDSLVYTQEITSLDKASQYYMSAIDTYASHVNSSASSAAGASSSAPSEATQAVDNTDNVSSNSMVGVVSIDDLHQVDKPSVGFSSSSSLVADVAIATTKPSNDGADNSSLDTIVGVVSVDDLHQVDKASVGFSSSAAATEPELSSQPEPIIDNEDVKRRKIETLDSIAENYGYKGSAASSMWGHKKSGENEGEDESKRDKPSNNNSR